ncbi:hypothetical protein RAD15_08665 [Bradyrhizobium sp. 14AA]
MFQKDKTWIDVNKDNSPLNAAQGSVDDQAYNQLHCMDGNAEIVRVANCNWNTLPGTGNAGFCYGCKLGFEKQPRWYCTKVDK